MATYGTPRALGAGGMGYIANPSLQPSFVYDAAQHLDSAGDWWKDCATRAVEYLAEGGQPFTVAEVVELGTGEPDHPNRWGALFQAAYKAGLIVPLGYTRSQRASRHGGVVRVWQGVSKAAA